MNTGTLTQYNNFINRLDTASEEQVQALKKADQIIEQKKSEYLQIQAKRKGLEKLLEKKAQKIAEKLSKAEQKLMDESALHSFFKSKSDN